MQHIPRPITITITITPTLIRKAQNPHKDIKPARDNRQPMLNPQPQPNTTTNTTTTNTNTLNIPGRQPPRKPSKSKIRIANRQRHRNLPERKRKVLARARTQLAVLRKAAPVRAHQLLVRDLRLGMEFLGRMFHMIVGAFQQALDHVCCHAAVHPGAVRAAGPPFVQGDHDEGLGEGQGGGLEGATGELGAGVFGVAVGGGEIWVCCCHEAGAEGEQGGEEDGLDGVDIAREVGDERGVVQEVDDGEFLAVEVAGGDEG